MQICLHAVLHKTQQRVAQQSCYVQNADCLRSGFEREGSDWGLPRRARNTKNNQSFKKHHGKHRQWLQQSPLIMTSVFSLIGTRTARTHTRSSPQTSLQSSAQVQRTTIPVPLSLSGPEAVITCFKVVRNEYRVRFHTCLALNIQY